jgi:hypothetical protein
LHLRKARGGAAEGFRGDTGGIQIDRAALAAEQISLTPSSYSVSISSVKRRATLCILSVITGI